MSVVNLVNYYNNKEYETLAVTLDQMREDALTKLVNSVFSDSFNDESLVAAKAIVHGCHQSSKQEKCACAIYKKAIDLLQKEKFGQKLLTDLLCILNNEINRLDPKNVESLCEYLLDILKKDKAVQGFCFKVFQKLIDVLPQHSSIKNEDAQLTTGFEFKQQLVENICSFKWQKNSFIHIITMVKELTLSALEVDIVTKKIILELKSVSLKDLPPLVFHVLAYANSHGKAAIMIEALVNCVNSFSKSNSEDQDLNKDSSVKNDAIKACEIEGTILLYISNSMKQNMSLGKSVLKMLKSVKMATNNKIFSPFFLALSMILVQDGRFTEDVLVTLRTLILKSFQDDYKRNSHKSLLQCTKEYSNIKEIVLKAASNCAHGWSHIVSGLVLLGFNIIATFGQKRTPFSKSVFSDSMKLSRPQTDACKVGTDIISTAFKTCKIVRSEIVRKIVTCIQSNLNNPAFLYIKLLKSIAKSYPQSLLHSNEQIKIMLDDLPLMHPNNAQKLFQAVLPLLKVSPDLRGSLILVLRKTLSCRAENSRICALNGFLMLLKNFPISEMSSLSQMSSQSSQSIFSSASLQASTLQSSPGPAHNRMLCMEVVQAVKKCLTQQHNVRLHLYNGMCNVILANPQLSSTVVETLLQHLCLFYEDDNDIIPPISIKSCLSKVDGSILEPLQHLLSAIGSICKQASSLNQTDSNEVLDEESILRINGIFQSLSQRLCKCEVGDFILQDNNDDQSSVKNENVAILLLSVHQVLIEYWTGRDDGADKALSLFQSYKKFYTHFTQNKISNFDKNLNESFHFSSTYTILFNALSAILEEDDNELSTNENFLKHMLSVFHGSFMHSCDSLAVKDEENLFKQQFFNDLTEASRLCFHKFLTEKNSPEQCPVLLLYLECFHSAVKFVTAWHVGRIPQFFSAINGKESTQSNCLVKLTNQVQRAIVSFISTDGPLSAYEKNLLTELLSLLETLLPTVLRHCDSDKQMHFADWCQKLCLEYELKDSGSAKRAIQLFLKSSLHSSSHPELPFRDLSTDIHLNVESAEEPGSDSQPTYKIITPENAYLIIPILTKHLENVMNHCDWLLAYIKACSLTAVNVDTDNLTCEESEARRKMEGAICVRVCTIGVGFLDLLTSTIENIAAIECIIVSLTTYFSFLIQLSKYYMWLCNQSNGTIPSRFEKLASFIGSEMMKPIYALIMRAQSMQSNKLSSGSKSKKSTTVQIAGKAKVLRGSKSISQLVFTIEQHEHNLILLARKSKIDLMKDYHLPTSRDFRIRSDVIQVTINDQDAQKDESDNTEGEEENEDETPPASKKSRLDTDA